MKREDSDEVLISETLDHCDGGERQIGSRHEGEEA